MIVHLDGDIVKYRCGFAAEKAVYCLLFSGGETVYFPSMKEVNDFLAKEENRRHVQEGVFKSREVEPLQNALHNVTTTIDFILERLSVTKSDLVVYISGDTNFRTSVPYIRKYKGNRDNAEKPTHGPAINQFFMDNYKTVVSSNMEADDAIGIAHMAAYRKLGPDSSVVVSSDKDLDMLPGLHYNYVKDKQYVVDDGEALLNFYIQLLVGDTSDNIVGVPGVGPVKARKLLAGCSDVVDYEQVCLSAYKEEYGDKAEEIYNQTKQLIWILQEEPKSETIGKTSLCV